MTVVFCGVGGDTTNVDPAPAADEYGRFEYVPIPEKCETTERATYGRLRARHADASLAEGLRRVYTRRGEWDDRRAVIENHPVHHDPNFDRFTYGEHRPGYVSRLRELEAGDAVAFYSGLRRPDDEYMNRHLLGYFAVDSVSVVDPAADYETTRALLEAHPHNAHAKRFLARGDLYYDDRPVVLVDGTAPGGLLRRAIRLTEWRDGRFVCTPETQSALFPGADGPVGLGSRKPARVSSLPTREFVEFVEGR
jgi:hypothetical protein